MCGHSIDYEMHTVCLWFRKTTWESPDIHHCFRTHHEIIGINNLLPALHNFFHLIKPFVV